MESFAHFLSKLSKSEVGLVLFILILPVILGELLFFRLIVTPALDMFRTSVFDIQHKIMKLLSDLETNMLIIRKQLDDIESNVKDISNQKQNRSSSSSNLLV